MLISYLLCKLRKKSWRGKEKDQFGKVARLILCRFYVHARAHTHKVNIYVMSELRSVEKKKKYNSCHTHSFFFRNFHSRLSLLNGEQRKAERKMRQREKKEWNANGNASCFRCSVRSDGFFELTHRMLIRRVNFKQHKLMKSHRKQANFFFVADLIFFSSSSCSPWRY